MSNEMAREKRMDASKEVKAHTDEEFPGDFMSKFAWYDAHRI
jgi:hypothetical protein